MPVKVLVLHASDFTVRADVFKMALKTKGYSATTIGEFGKPESDSAYAVVQKAIDSHHIVIVLASTGLFNSCLLRFGVGYALGSGKTVISVVKDPDEIILPSWYSRLFDHIYNDLEMWLRLKKAHA